MKRTHATSSHGPRRDDREARAKAPKDLLICLLLLGAVWAVFGQVRHFPLVDFDDLIYVTDNRHVAAGLTLESVSWAFTRSYEGYWAPLTWLSYMADVQFAGLDGGALHLTNVLLHAASTCLLFVLLQRATRARWSSAFVAALFAIHPLHVESVAWVAERKDVLSGFFWFLTCWAYFRYVERPGPVAYALVVGSFACGLMSKPMIVTLPVVLLALDVWPLGRLSIRAAAEGAGSRRPSSPPLQRSLAWLLGEKAPLVAMSLVVAAVTFVTQRNAGGVASLDVIPPLTRIGNALLSYVIYLAKMVWPSRLAALYPHPLAVPAWQAVAAGLALAAVTVLVVRAARRRPYLLTGWLWYLVSLLPVLGLIQAGVQARADRYTYVPMVGVGIMVAWGLADLVRGSAALGRALAAAACVILSVHGVVARQQVQYWQDSETLFRRALSVTTDNYVVHTALGKAVRQNGRVDEAIAQFQEAIRLRPDFAEAHDALGEALNAAQRPGEALPHLAEAVRLSPATSGYLVNLASALASLGRTDEAAASYREAIRRAPGSAQARSGLGGALVAQGRFEEARGELNEAIRLDPGYAAAHHNLGALLSRMGRGDEAVGQFLEVVKLTPESVQAHLDLGTLLANQGRIDEAIAELAVAARLKPDEVMVRNNLGGALLSAGRIDEAIAQFTEAVRLRPDLPQLRNNLDMALARRRAEHRD